MPSQRFLMNCVMPCGNIIYIFLKIEIDFIKLQLKILIKWDNAMCCNMRFNYSQALISSQQSMRKQFGFLHFKVSLLRFMY
jgi:hypothetical protein